MTASAGAWYRVGKVNVTNGVKTISGAGSKWLNDLVAIAVGDAFTVDAKTWYEVIAVNSDTSIVLDRGYEGGTAAGVNYAILRSTSGTILTRIAGQISVQFNQKQLFLDELRNWLTSTDSSVSLTDSHGNTYQYKSLNNIQALTGTVVSRDVGTSAGNVMEVGAFGLGNTKGVRLENDNGDTISRTGTYSTPAAWAGSPYVGTNTDNQGSLQHNQSFALAENYATQTFISMSLGNRCFFRKKSQGVWSPWNEIYHTRNTVGTVSQSGGVPTGAIIERGSGPNVKYSKYACGLAILHGTMQFDWSSVVTQDLLSNVDFIAPPSIAFSLNTITAVTDKWGSDIFPRGMGVKSSLQQIVSGRSGLTSVSYTLTGYWY